LLFHERFDYEVGGSLNGKAGGTGFSEPWLTRADPGQADEQIVQGNLQHPGVSSSGNKVLATAQGERSEITSERYLGRAISENDPNNPVLWVSFLFQKEAGYDGVDSFGIQLNPPLTGDTTNSRAVFFGDLAETRNSSGPNNFGILSYVMPLNRVPTDAAKVGEVAIGTTNLVVGRLTFNPNGNETFDLFINPAAGVVPTTPDATATGFNLATVNYISILGGNENVIDAIEDPSVRVAYQMDEIRGGTTYFDVVPEPSTALSLTLGLGLLAGRRRRAGTRAS
jgi:hypothetical protein